MVFTRLFELIYFQLERYPSKNSFNQKILGRWEERSTAHFIEQMNELSYGLFIRNIPKGSRIVIFCEYGSTDWIIIDFACLQLGLVTVPVNPNHTEEELRFILSEVEATFCFVNEDLLAQRLLDCDVPSKKIIGFGNSIKYKSWSDLLESVDQDAILKLDNLKAQVDENDLATIIYTSGSTGKPKGVMLSHRNIVSNIKSIVALIPVNYRHRVASYLPLSHIFERMVLYTYISIGAKIFFIQDPKTLLKSVQDIKPDYVSSVPRVLEKIYSEIQSRVKKSNPIARYIVRMALKVGTKDSKSGFGKFKNTISLWLADLFVYSRWRKVLGGSIKGIIVGAASLPEHIGRLYSRAGIPVKEGYGLTETSPVISFNRFEAGGTKYGTVGITIPGVELRIVKPNDQGEGEIAVRGPNVMLGYYKNEELTSSRIDKDNWFYTGDIGKIVDDKFLSLTGRKKDIFKTSSGLFVYPQKIEEQLRMHDAIDQCMVIGFQRSYITALIIPDFVMLKAWCKTQGIHWTAELYMVENDRVKAYFDQVIAEVNNGLKSHERVIKFKLLKEEWSISSGEYTPTLKLRRQKIQEKYLDDIEKMYQ